VFRDSLNQATRCLERGDYSAGLIYLEQARARNPAGTDEMWYRFGQYHENPTRVGGTEDAIASYRHLVQQFPPSKYYNSPHFSSAMDRLVILKDKGLFVPPIVFKKDDAPQWKIYFFPTNWPLVIGFFGERLEAVREILTEAQNAEYNELIAAYDRALAEDPGNPGILTALAGLYADRNNPGDADLALRYSETALALLPGDPTPLYVRIAVYTNNRDYEKAVNTLYELIGVSGEDPVIYYQIALIEEARGNNGKAAEALKKALELDPDFTAAREKLNLL
jgi:tetratricopeptide (TPR) repeat protein